MALPHTPRFEALEAYIAFRSVRAGLSPPLLERDLANRATKLGPFRTSEPRIHLYRPSEHITKLV